MLLSGSGELALRGDPRRTRQARTGSFYPDTAGDLEASYGIVLGEQCFGAEVADGRIEVFRGAPGNPDASIKTAAATLGALVYEGGDLDEALRSEGIEIEGERAAVDRLLELFPMPSPAPSPTGSRRG